jgi:hypothetical protein
MRPLILAAALMLGACSPQFVATVTPICDSMRVIYISKSDVLTESTAQALEGNNLAHEKLCGPSPRPQRTETKAKKGEIPTT